MDKVYEWDRYSVTDNRANDIMIWENQPSGEPEVIYQIDAETLFKLIEGCLATDVMQKTLVTKNIYDVSFKDASDILNA